MPAPSEILHRSLRVLIVEDEHRLRELLLEVIPEMGFPARAVRTAEEAIRIMQHEPQDILILDLQLPAMHGMELFERLRKDWPLAQIIILTGFGDLPTAQRAIQLDVVEFLTKPCHLRDVELALERARRRLEKKRLPHYESDSKEEPTGVPLAVVEHQHILAALQRHNGNKTAAAAELGISRRTLHYRLAEYRSGGNPAD